MMPLRVDDIYLQIKQSEVNAEPFSGIEAGGSVYFTTGSYAYAVRMAEVSDTVGRTSLARVINEATDVVTSEPKIGMSPTIVVINAMTGVPVETGGPSSTAPAQVPADLSSNMKRVIASAGGELFEDGIESQLQRDLAQLIHAYGAAAIDTLARSIADTDLPKGAASEAIRLLGDIDSDVTYSERRHLLLQSLYSESGYIRYGAAIGLAYLDDSTTERFVRSAYERERKPAIRNVMRKVLQQLEQTKTWHSTFIA